MVRIQLAFALFALILFLLGHFALSHQVALLEKKATRFKNETALLLPSYEVADKGEGLILPRMKAVSAYSNATGELFEKLSEVPRHALCLLEITRTYDETLIVGRMRDEMDLTAFLRAWPGAALFSEMKIEQIEKNEATADWHFRLRAIAYKKIDRTWEEEVNEGE